MCERIDKIRQMREQLDEDLARVDPRWYVHEILDESEEVDTEDDEPFRDESDDTEEDVEEDVWCDWGDRDQWSDDDGDDWDE